MEEYVQEISRIKEALEQHPEGLSITDIAGLLHINRNSVAKYMDILQIQGSVDGKKRGTSKVYFITHRVAVSSLGKVCHQPFAVFDQDGRAIDHNTLFSTMTGLGSDQIAGQPLENLPFRILDGGTAQQVFRIAFKGLEQQVQAQVTGSGGEKTVNLYFLPVVFNNGKPGVAVIVDEGAHTATAVSDYLPGPDPYKILDTLVEYVVRYSPDGILQDVNEPYCRATGRSRGDLVGRPFKHLVSAGDSERILQNRTKLSVQYPSGMIEFRAVMANGEARWQRWWDRALFDERGEVTGYYSTGIDITDEVLVRTTLKKTREMLEETIVTRTNELREINRQLYDEMACRERMEQQLLMTQFAMDNAADMIFWVNRNAGVDYANEAAISGLGYTEEECAALAIVDIIAMMPAPASWTDTWQFLRRAGTVTRETFMVRKDGTRIPVEMVIRFLEYRQTGFACCFARDISDRARMEKTLQLANKKLNVLASLTRHDIQNKVTILLGYLSRAIKREQDPEVLEYLQRQEHAAQAIRDEITVTRDYKDLGADPPEWLPVREVVASAIARQEKSPVAFDAGLPDLMVYADRQLEQVFFRLIENAVTADLPPPAIRISLKDSAPGVVITVEYDGLGIRVGDKERIFQPGSTVTGMRGLFITREILSLTGITLLETGVPGKMTRFEMGVPPESFRWKNPPGP